MEADDEIYSKLKSFSEINSQFRIFFNLIDSKPNLSQKEKNDRLCDYISRELLIIPQHVLSIVEHFPAVIPKLILQAVTFSYDSIFNFQRHVLNCILLSKAIKVRPDLKGYAVNYFEKYPSPFEEDTRSTPKKSRIALTENVFIRDVDIVEASYFLVKSNPKFYRQKWKWSSFIKTYSLHKDAEVIWLSCHTIGIVLGLNESTLQTLLAQRLPEDVNLKLTIEFDANNGFTKQSQDIPLLDQKPHIRMKPKDFSEVVCVSGIYIPALNNPKEDLLVEVLSTYNNLRKIAIGISSNKALCIQGSVGSGKTGLVDHLASKTGRKLGESFIKIQLGDQTDSKMLLGTYRCTDTPGEFIWQPGVLTQAVIEGSWLLLEDIDSASTDIASVLASLLENNALTVPGYRDLVPITSGFQLFVTQRLITTISGNHKKHSNAVNLLEKQLLQITIDPLTSDELKEILRVKYPQFNTINERLVKVFELFSKKEDDSLVRKSGRLISTRDFFKWCSRAAIDFDVKSQTSALNVLQDAIDVFCCSIPDVEEALNLAREVSTQLGIIHQKAEYFFKQYKPNMQLKSNCLVAGRVSLNREHSIYSKQAKFCFTRPAAVLLERVMCCVKLKEPVLLVGETGTGKTSSVQFLAHSLGKKLVVINMNQQSDSADLLGGFKPVDLKVIISPIRKQFEEVFKDFFSVESNREFLSNIAYAYNKQKFTQLVKSMLKSTNAALRRLTTNLQEPVTDELKRQKDQTFFDRWQAINKKLQKVQVQLKQANALYFAFIEGSLVKAVQEGSWVLLDEINLANAETLECLSGLLEGTEGSLCLLERGDKQPILRNPDFTLFACMNPATNVGKKDLPIGLRNRFTQFYVDELTEKSDLILLVNSYLSAMSLKEQEVLNIVDFYLKIRTEMQLTLSDGLGHKPHFSLRSLCRALMIASKNPCGTFKRSLYEAFCLSFLTQLDSKSYSTVEYLIARFLIGDEKRLKAVLRQPIPEPKDAAGSFLEFEGYWIKKGHLQPTIPENYVLTGSVRKNLKDLARVVSVGKLPVLLQGDTSVGKTSLISYLAKSSGNKCVRINNHEHTDLQEYIGSYVADVSGKLVFREGVLVEAMRKGHWIILDELNLAPTDVLEALNRVLDDNRELFIPETQETVKADPNFMLFATQNPPGVYGGRKMLSRAFRNRFVELHFNEIPPTELEFILHRRCAMPPSYAKRMISAMTDLQVRRRGSAAFAGKQGFITLRDLFRWGERYRLAQNSDKLYDWNQHLADEGYLVLAAKVRKEEEKKEIVDVLEKHWQRKVVIENLFSLHENTSTVTKHILQKIENNNARYPNIVWTFNMRKLAVLVAKALEFKEPVLLVGETGGGKTTICQLIAENNGQELAIVNCHMHTESSDFIGGLRPVRDHSENNKSLFEWVDGPLLQAMLKGSVFLADEISLADDSVLERLNSLLEPERTLLLAEKGIDLNNVNNSETVVAHPDFFFIGTMNPGGDYGKKELSPALRNRFTEIWCESCNDRDDLIAIVEKNLTCKGFGSKIMNFIEWFRNTEIGKRYTISIRDILTWVNFINVCSTKMCVNDAYLHGAHLVFLDSFGSGATSNESTHSLNIFKESCTNFLETQMKTEYPNFQASIKSDMSIVFSESQLGIDPFLIETGQEKPTDFTFSFEAPTTILNTLNLLRGMQLNKAILLEGSPGVGKTTLVTALAKYSRHKIFRVNLSDQTDISDLFGADLPVDGGTGGQFSWRDGPLLQALKEGSWILLDELNLASQSVLEGLNACLDHRGEIFIPELGKTFYVKTGTRFFACQNPMKQGGSRRGLPKSFLNRFIQVYVSPFNCQDMNVILSSQFPSIPNDIIAKMIDFNFKLAEQLDSHTFGNRGAPWECNLRDLSRWCQATLYHYENCQSDDKQFSPESTVQLIYIDRMRTLADKRRVEELFIEVMGCPIQGSHPVGYINVETVHFGDASVKRGQDQPNDHVLNDAEGYLITRGQLGVLRSLSYCVNQNWMAILVGSSGVGKSSVVKTLANLTGKTLKTLTVTSAMDTTDILGGFEQANYSRHLEEIAKETERQTLASVQNLLMEEKVNKAVLLLEYWEEYLSISDTKTQTMEEEVRLFLRRISKLEELLKELYLKCSSTSEGNIILQLLSRCSKIYESVNNEKSLSAGGRFEWVNSVLVKCLQEGSWLLVDNVNLCSAAVLDRLNALLEPNGVLTISEKGVDESGNMFEVKPHPDFRIFLTMDPKNGEISRAMKNRGVEIHMLNETENVYSHQFDLKSLIDSKGLSNPSHINGLIKIHEFISSLILSEKPQNTDILQCSSLISQQICHGTNVFDAFYSTCVEIYYKTRSSSEFNCNNVLEVIRDGVLRCLNENGINEDSYDKTVTLNTKDLARWSDLERVKHQSAVLKTAIKYFKADAKSTRKLLFKDNSENMDIGSERTKGTYRSNDSTIWSDLEVVKLQNDFFSSIKFYFLANLLSINYTISSKKDIDLRTLFLKKIVKQKEWLSTLERFDKVTRFFELEEHNIPIDYRWITGLSRKHSDGIVCNVINYALQVEIHKSKDLFEVKHSPNNSLYHFILALRKKSVSDRFNSPICKNYLDLRNEHFVFMRQIFMHFARKTDPEACYVKILELLSWRQALHGFLTSVSSSDGRMSNPRTIASKLEAMAIYYKWFYKYSVEAVAKLLDAKVPQALADILREINEQIEEQFSNSYKIAKNYKKINNTPESLKYEWQLSAVELLNKYDLLDSKVDHKKILNLFTNNPELRRLLVKLKYEICSENESSAELDLIMAFDQNKSSEESLKLHEFQVLPLVDMIMQLRLLYIMKEIFSGNDYDLDGVQNNILIPSEFHGLLLKYKESRNKTLFHEIKKWFYSFNLRSASANPNKFTNIKENKGINSLLSGVVPILSNIMTQLLVYLDNNAPRLSNFRDVRNQQRSLGSLLWNNIHGLVNDKFNYGYLQLTVLLRDIEFFIQRTENALNIQFCDFNTRTYNAVILNEIGDNRLASCILRILKKNFHLLNNMEPITKSDQILSYIGDLHMQLAFAEIYLNSLLPQVDPLAKRAMKKNHIVSVIDMFEQMKTSFELQNSLYSNIEGCHHPYYKSIKSILNTLKEKVESFGNSTHIGNEAYPYNYIVQQIKHAFNSAINTTLVSDINDCTETLNKLKSGSTKTSSADIDKVKSYIERFKSSIPSYERIFHDWKLYRSSYPDIIEPLLANISQFLFGLKLKLYWLNREFMKWQHETSFDIDLETELIHLAAIPSLNENVDSLDKHADNYTGTRMKIFIDHILQDTENPFIKAKENLRLLKCGIQECYNQCVVNTINSGALDRDLLYKFKNLVAFFINMWNSEQERIEKEKDEAESIYKTKTKCDDKSEEEEQQEELTNLFPNHHVIDFSDLQENSLSNSAERISQSDKDSAIVITEEDLKFVIQLNANLYKNFVKTEWLSPQISKNISPDYVTPLMEKLKLVRRVMDNYAPYFKYSMDAKLSTSLAVLLEVTSRYGAIHELTDSATPTRIINRNTKDFYRSSNVEEVKSCYHVLEELKLKVQELLNEWPDQPTLNTILAVIDRIESFDIASPVSRFLTGFDILLSKCYEWEQVAHHGVSLIQITPNLVAQIIAWRKLELSGWRELMNSTLEDLKKPLSKWWLYMYNLMNQYINEKMVTESDLIDVLQKFITKSNLAEFHGRLDIILEFHCHAVTLPLTSESESFVNILWNVNNYYRQFASSVTSKIRDLRTPIEKKLRDYIKIVKWKDVTYWSIKDTVDKTHKTLHKFVREFKQVLLQPVTPYFTNPVMDNPMENIGIFDRPQRQNPKSYHYTLDVDSYVVKSSAKDSPYLSTARKICKDTILGTNYPDLVKTLDGFITDVIETSSHLRNLEVDTSLPKEKQKSQAKNILNQKHRALADLFQNLSKMGLSYKSGIMHTKLKKITDEYTVEPLDLAVSYSHLGCNRTDEKLLIIWESCETYFFRSLMRLDVLETALVSPARDLGMQNVERCRGFAAQLLAFCQNQKKILLKASRTHYYLRNYLKQIREVSETASFISYSTFSRIKTALNSLTVTVSQIKLILNCCPEEEIFEDQTSIDIPSLEPKTKKLRFKRDENWNLAFQHINDITTAISKVNHFIQKAEGVPCASYGKVKTTFVPLNNKDKMLQEIHKLVNSIDNLKLIFEPIEVAKNLCWLSELFKQITEEESLVNPKERPNSETDFKTLMDQATRSILIVFQNLYKKYGKSPDAQHEKSEEEEDVGLQENHLKTLVIENLSSDVVALELDKILGFAEKIVQALIGGSFYVSTEMKNAIVAYLPLFDQVLQLSQYFITQQVAAYRISTKLTSILLNIFIDLASKGFCIPPELSDEMDKEGMSKPSDGMGLGEGQGERDVSDKIESEDQLDDAQPAGQEKENTEDPDCKEEDKGIEMSEDFESKLQDKKPNDDDEDNSQSDHSDAEEQMGETEKGADQLDQEIWGDEKDEANEGDEEPEQNEEEGQGGEKEGEHQLGAKEENTSKEKSKNQDPTTGQDEESEKNKKEINEMNEPEYDDEQTDPYHGNQPELPEPEPMDLPDDLQLDEGEEKDGEQPEENPFDIDDMKEQQIPENPPETTDDQLNEDKQNDEEKDFSSDDEDVTKKDGDDGPNEDSAESNEDKTPEEENVDTPKESREAENEDESNVDGDESALDQNPTNQDNVEAMEVDDAEALDKTQAAQSENLKSDQPIEETCQEDKPDKEGVGQSQMEESETGHSVQSSVAQEAKNTTSNKDEEKKRKEKPGESDSKRSLGDVNQEVKKKLKTLNANENDKSINEEVEDRTEDTFQHIKDATEEKSTQVLDAATKEQAEEQQKETTHKDDIQDEDVDADGTKDLSEEQEEPMDVDESDTKNERSIKPESSKEKNKNKTQHPEGDIMEDIQDVEIEGDIVETTTVPRGGESFHHTQFQLLQNNPTIKLTQEEMHTIRTDVEKQLSSWKSAPTSAEAELAWRRISSVTSSLAQDLSEQLRLVLEPTQASQLKGDFRTGRRINMRKVIPYIASQFRKDKIWLRRTKPSKREYQIVLAIDDSSSMADNHSKELAFESVALISKALSLLESGQLSVVSFGETTEVHHKLSDQFTDQCGIQLLQNFQFDQQKTLVGKLVDFVTEMFEQNNVQTSIPNAKLLLIVSDGRGVFSEGKSYVSQAVRRAKLSNIFIVFVIIDSPESKNSILDIRSTVFKDGKLLGLQNYMDEFPFSFYIILRDINSLPGVLSDALMQWFEMVTSQQ